MSLFFLVFTLNLILYVGIGQTNKQLSHTHRPTKLLTLLLTLLLKNVLEHGLAGHA
jgi:hypothetical protein